MTELEKELLERVDLLTRGVPFHLHKCPDGDEHEWRCSSPYCHVLRDSCEDHGGLTRAERARPHA